MKRAQGVSQASCPPIRRTRPAASLWGQRASRLLDSLNAQPRQPRAPQQRRLCHECELTSATKTPTMALRFSVLSCAEKIDARRGRRLAPRRLCLNYGANAGCDVEADAGLP